MSLFDIQDKIRKSIPSEDLRDWLKIDDFRAWKDLVLDWTGILTGVLIYSWHPTIWTFIFAFFCVGFCQYGLFILGHDAIHGSLFSNRRVNDGVSRWLIHGPMCMGFDDGKFSHLEHHKLLGSLEDPDRYLHTLANKNSPLLFLLFCSGLATFGKTVLKVTPIGKVLKLNNREVQLNGAEPGRKPRDTVSKILSEHLKQRIPVLFWQPALIVFLICLLKLPWWSYFALWIAPIYVCVFVADEIRAFCDHAVAAMPDRDVDDLRLISYVPNLIERTIFSPHDMNYHAEHHLWPKVPYYNRRKAHALVKDSGHITVHKSYLSFLLKILRSCPIKENDSVNNSCSLEPAQ